MHTADRKRKGKVAVDQKRTSQGRHGYRCTICTYAEGDEIATRECKVYEAFLTRCSRERCFSLICSIERVL
jgi:hypothetical protein